MGMAASKMIHAATHNECLHDCASSQFCLFIRDVKFHFLSTVSEDLPSVRLFGAA